MVNKQLSPAPGEKITAGNLYAGTAWHKQYANWPLFFIYLLVLGFSISKHELWGDELHSWNIARSSTGIGSLIANTRYEGHPPLWYILLFTLSKFTHNPLAIQQLHFCICGLTVFLFLFQCRLAGIYKLMIIFGYYFLYEYGTLSRNYAPAILLAFIACSIAGKEFKYKTVLYYCLLLLLSNTHFLALILACAFHVYYLWPVFKDKTQRTRMIAHTIFGAVILAPALYFIFPPSGSGLDVSFWVKLWDRQHLAIAMQAPLKALSPVPAWWEYHAWNTHALLQAQKSHAFLKFLTPLLSAGLAVAGAYVLFCHKRSLIFYLVNIALTLGFALVFPLNSVRYVGFIFIGFIVALWLSNSAQPFDQGRRSVLILLLFLQLAGAFVAVKKDWQLPFTHAYEIKKMSTLVPAGSEIITDYWCLNYATAFLDKPLYCVGFNKKKSFLLWDREMMQVAEKTGMYTEGTKIYFERSGRRSVYFMANTPKHDIVARDSLFFKSFHIELIKSYDNAMEKYSNIYLYRLSLK